MKKIPKVLFIDWHNTLSYSFFWSQLSDKNHPHNNYHKTIVHWLFEKNRPLVEKWMLGLLNSEQICNQLAIENNLDKKIILDTLKESSEKMELCSDDVLDIIKDIRNKNIKVVIATDNMDTFRKFTIQGLNLDRFFDDFLISSELNVLKYNVTNDKIPFFDPFLKKNKLDYNDVVLLDDSEEKSGVYNKLGFKISLVTDTSSLLNYLREYLD